jgi:hypothetical protein
MGRCREYLARMRDCDGGEHEVVVSLASLHGDPAALISSLCPLGHENQMHASCAPAICRIPRLRPRRGTRDDRSSHRLARDRRCPRLRAAR